MGNNLLKSDVILAQTKATAIQTAVSDVLTFQSVTQDTQTTVRGNVKVDEGAIKLQEGRAS